MNDDKDETLERAVVVRHWRIPGVTKRKKENHQYGTGGDLLEIRMEYKFIDIIYICSHHERRRT
jgi:hypothetical protein